MKSVAHFLFTQELLHLPHSGTTKTPAETQVPTCPAQPECNVVPLAQNAAQAHST